MSKRLRELADHPNEGRLGECLFKRIAKGWDGTVCGFVQFGGGGSGGTGSQGRLAARSYFAKRSQ